MDRRAFSIVELLVVIGVMMILIALALPLLSGSREAARRNVCLRQLTGHGQIVQMYAGDNAGYWPYALERARRSPPVPDGVSDDPVLSQTWYTVIGGLWHMAVLDAYDENPIHESLICPSDEATLKELEAMAQQAGVPVTNIGGTTSSYYLSTAMYLDPVALDPAAPAWEERYFRGTRMDEVLFPSAKASLHETAPWHDAGYDQFADVLPIPATYNVLAVDGSGEARRSDTFTDPVLPVPDPRGDWALKLQRETSKLDLTAHGVRGKDW